MQKMKGAAVNTTTAIADGVSLQPVGFKGRLYSKEHREKFRTDHLMATVERSPQENGKFRLCIDRIPILEWFRMKFQELKGRLGVSCTQKEDNTPKRGVRFFFH